MLQADGTLYLAGLFLRFGVPLGLTIILAWLLRNMDLRWMEEGEPSVESNRIENKELSEICWIVHNFVKDDGVELEAQETCWKVRMRFEGILPSECLDCEIFQEGLLEIAA